MQEHISLTFEVREELSSLIEQCSLAVFKLRLAYGYFEGRFQKDHRDRLVSAENTLYEAVEGVSRAEDALNCFCDRITVTIDT